MSTFQWGKTLAAVVTPMDAKGNVNYELAGELCRNIIANGCDGVVVAGTTGEAATLTNQEKIQLFAAVKAKVKDRGLVIAGVGANSTRAVLELVEACNSLPVDGYMVITPYYNKPNHNGLVAHFQAIDGASTKPVMIYNVPSRTGLDLSCSDYAAILNTCPRITAVKEASADLEKASQLAAQYRHVCFLSGNDSLTLPLLALGFQGVVSVAANLVPAAMAEITRRVSAGDWSGARLMHNRLFPLFKAVFWETNPVPVKAGLEIQGWPVGGPRLPLAALAQHHQGKLRDLLAEYTREGL